MAGQLYNPQMQDDQKEVREHAWRLVSKLPSMFAKNKQILPLAFAWPTKPIQADDKTQHDIDLCFVELDEVKAAEWSSTLRMLVEKTGAKALLLMEQRGQEVIAILEMHQGTRTWRFPIRRHGDVTVLEPAQVSTNVESIGLLWSSTTAKA